MWESILGRCFIWGGGIVQVVVAAALMGLLAMVFSQLITSGMKGQRTVGQSAEFQNLQNIVTTALARPAPCAQIFVTAGGAAATYTPFAAPPLPTSPIPPPPAVTPASINQINLVVGANASPVLTRGQEVGAGLRISQMHFETLPGFPLAGTPIAANVEHAVQLIVGAQRNREGATGPEFINNRRSPFIMTLITTAAGQIIDCGRAAGGVSMGFRKRVVVPGPAPDLGSGVRTATGCMTDDWYDSNDMELFIQCAK